MTDSGEANTIKRDLLVANLGTNTKFPIPPTLTLALSLALAPSSQASDNTGRLARYHFGNDRFEQALDNATSALKAAPADAALLEIAALSSCKLDRLSDCVRYCQRLLQAAPAQQAKVDLIARQYGLDAWTEYQRVATSSDPAELRSWVGAHPTHPYLADVKARACEAEVRRWGASGESPPPARDCEYWDEMLELCAESSQHQRARSTRQGLIATLETSWARGHLQVSIVNERSSVTSMVMPARTEYEEWSDTLVHHSAYTAYFYHFSAVLRAVNVDTTRGLSLSVAIGNRDCNGTRKRWKLDLGPGETREEALGWERDSPCGSPVIQAIEATSVTPSIDDCRTPP